MSDGPVSCCILHCKPFFESHKLTTIFEPSIWMALRELAVDHGGGLDVI